MHLAEVEHPGVHPGPSLILVSIVPVLARRPHPLSQKIIRNSFITLRSLSKWKWWFLSACQPEETPDSAGRQSGPCTPWHPQTCSGLSASCLLDLLIKEHSTLAQAPLSDALTVLDPSHSRYGSIILPLRLNTPRSPELDAILQVGTV